MPVTSDRLRYLYRYKAMQIYREENPLGRMALRAVLLDRFSPEGRSTQNYSRGILENVIAIDNYITEMMSKMIF